MRIVFLSLIFLASASAQQQTPIRVEDFVLNGGDGVTLVKDPFAPLSFRLPGGWRLQQGVRWGAYETTLELLEVGSGLTASLYYQYPQTTPQNSDPDLALRGFMNSKVRQRREREGLTDYTIREATIQRRMVAGRPALSFYADYTARTRAQPGVRMTEYVLRVMSVGIKAHIFLTAPASTDLAPFVKHIDGILEGMQIPDFPTR